MAAPSVTYNFIDATTIVHSEVNQNFTDLINGMSDGNDDFTISALTCGGAVALNANVDLGNATGDDIAITGRVTTDIDPKTAATNTLGDATQTWLSLYLDGGVTDGGAVYFNASSTAFLKSNAAGTTLSSGGFTTVALPAVTVSTTLGVTGLSSLAALTCTGAFTSLGIDDNANAIAMTIDSSENIGIGVVAPARRLGLHTASSDRCEMTFTNDTTGSTSGNGLEVGISSAEAAYMWNYENTLMGFGTNNLQRMTILADGSVGIGTTSPELLCHIYAGDASRVPNTNSQLVVENSGHTGINILSGASSNGALYFGDTGDAAGGSVQYEQTGNNMKLYTAATLAMTIDSSQQVGIGATPITNVRTVIDGAGSASSTTALMVRTSDPTTYFQCRDDEVTFTNDGTVSSLASDIRLKTNIRDIDDALETLCKLNPVHFDWKVPEAHRKLSQAGFIAQDVQKVKPHWVIKGNLDKREYIHIPEEEEETVLTTQFGDLNAYLIKAMQEQQAMIDELRKDIAILKAG